LWAILAISAWIDLLDHIARARCSIWSVISYSFPSLVLELISRSVLSHSGILRSSGSRAKKDSDAFALSRKCDVCWSWRQTPFALLAGALRCRCRGVWGGSRCGPIVSSATESVVVSEQLIDCSGAIDGALEPTSAADQVSALRTLLALHSPPRGA
jgi:hypothetical protein